ncbi:hypothetical protein QAD02_023842, partial [Eretmocerus hayati]
STMDDSDSETLFIPCDDSKLVPREKLEQDKMEYTEADFYVMSDYKYPEKEIPVEEYTGLPKREISCMFNPSSEDYVEMKPIYEGSSNSTDKAVELSPCKSCFVDLERAITPSIEIPIEISKQLSLQKENSILIPKRELSLISESMTECNDLHVPEFRASDPLDIKEECRSPPPGGLPCEIDSVTLPDKLQEMKFVKRHKKDGSKKRSIIGAEVREAFCDSVCPPSAKKSKSDSLDNSISNTASEDKIDTNIKSDSCLDTEEIYHQSSNQKRSFKSKKTKKKSTSKNSSRPKVDEKISSSITVKDLSKKKSKKKSSRKEIEKSSDHHSEKRKSSSERKKSHESRRNKKTKVESKDVPNKKVNCSKEKSDKEKHKLGTEKSSHNKENSLQDKLDKQSSKVVKSVPKLTACIDEAKTDERHDCRKRKWNDFEDKDSLDLAVKVKEEVLEDVHTEDHLVETQEKEKKSQKKKKKVCFASTVKIEDCGDSFNEKVKSPKKHENSSNDQQEQLSMSAEVKTEPIEFETFNGDKFPEQHPALLSIKEESPAHKRRYSRHKPIDLSDAKYRKPFDFGWTREIVIRGTVTETGARCDVYYHSPDNRKVRSLKQIDTMIRNDKNLTVANFTLRHRRILSNQDTSKEIVRLSHTKKTDGYEDLLSSIKFTSPEDRKMYNELLESCTPMKEAKHLTSVKSKKQVSTKSPRNSSKNKSPSNLPSKKSSKTKTAGSQHQPRAQPKELNNSINDLGLATPSVTKVTAKSSKKSTKVSSSQSKKSIKIVKSPGSQRKPRAQMKDLNDSVNVLGPAIPSVTQKLNLTRSSPDQLSEILPNSKQLENGTVPPDITSQVDTTLDSSQTSEVFGDSRQTFDDRSFVDTDDSEIATDVPAVGLTIELTQNDCIAQSDVDHEVESFNRKIVNGDCDSEQKSPIDTRAEQTQVKDFEQASTKNTSRKSNGATKDNLRRCRPRHSNHRNKSGPTKITATDWICTVNEILEIPNIRNSLRASNGSALSRDGSYRQDNPSPISSLGSPNHSLKGPSPIENFTTEFLYATLQSNTDEDANIPLSQDDTHYESSIGEETIADTESDTEQPKDTPDITPSALSSTQESEINQKEFHRAAEIMEHTDENSSVQPHTISHTSIDHVSSNHELNASNGRCLPMTVDDSESPDSGLDSILNTKLEETITSIEEKSKEGEQTTAQKDEGEIEMMALQSNMQNDIAPIHESDYVNRHAGSDDDYSLKTVDVSQSDDGRSKIETKSSPNLTDCDDSVQEENQVTSDANQGHKTTVENDGVAGIQSDIIDNEIISQQNELNNENHELDAPDESLAKASNHGFDISDESLTRVEVSLEPPMKLLEDIVDSSAKLNGLVRSELTRSVQNLSEIDDSSETKVKKDVNLPLQLITVDNGSTLDQRNGLRIEHEPCSTTAADVSKAIVVDDGSSVEDEKMIRNDESATEIREDETIPGRLNGVVGKIKILSKADPEVSLDELSVTRENMSSIDVDISESILRESKCIVSCNPVTTSLGSIEQLESDQNPVATYLSSKPTAQEDENQVKDKELSTPATCAEPLNDDESSCDSIEIDADETIKENVTISELNYSPLCFDPRINELLKVKSDKSTRPSQDNEHMSESMSTTLSVSYDSDDRSTTKFDSDDSSSRCGSSPYRSTLNTSELTDESAMIDQSIDHHEENALNHTKNSDDADASDNIRSENDSDDDQDIISTASQEIPVISEPPHRIMGKSFGPHGNGSPQLDEKTALKSTEDVTASSEKSLPSESSPFLGFPSDNLKSLEDHCAILQTEMTEEDVLESYSHIVCQASPSFANDISDTRESCPAINFNENEIIQQSTTLGNELMEAYDEDETKGVSSLCQFEATHEEAAHCDSDFSDRTKVMSHFSGNTTLDELSDRSSLCSYLEDQSALNCPASEETTLLTFDSGTESAFGFKRNPNTFGNPSDPQPAEADSISSSRTTQSLETRPSDVFSGTKNACTSHQNKNKSMQLHTNRGIENVGNFSRLPSCVLEDNECSFPCSTSELRQVNAILASDSEIQSESTLSIQGTPKALLSPVSEPIAAPNHLQKRTRYSSYETDFYTHSMVSYDAIHKALKIAFQYLNFKDLLRCRETSQTFRDLAEFRVFWKKVCLNSSEMNRRLVEILNKYGTEHLEIVNQDEDDWTSFVDAISEMKYLKNLKLCACPASVLERIVKSCPHLEVISATSIQCDCLNVEQIRNVNLRELYLRATESMFLIGDLTTIARFSRLTHLSLRSIKNLKIALIEAIHFSHGLVLLELGECTEFDDNFGSGTLIHLQNLERLRLENVSSSGVADILAVVSKLGKLSHLELVNVDITVGFDANLHKCRNIRKLMLVPSYESKEKIAQTNKSILRNTYSLTETLKKFTWGVNEDLVRLPIESSDKDSVQSTEPMFSAEMMKVLYGVGEERSAVQVVASDSFSLATIRKFYEVHLPRTSVKILQMPSSQVFNLEM